MVARGIASKVGPLPCTPLADATTTSVDGEKQRFLQMNKEKVQQFTKFNTSHIYLAIGGTLSELVICIKDPVRDESKQVIADLHALGIKKIVMMTGDSKRNAQRVADELGIDEVHAEVLPEDKAAYVKQAKAEGYNCHDGRG
ncbi:MAG: HAD-IC family P-type ATPase [Veillonella atypica]